MVVDPDRDIASPKTQTYYFDQIARTDDAGKVETFIRVIKFVLIVSNSNDNRAISALFRVFGEAERPVSADTQILAECRGMHRDEYTVLSILIPLTVCIGLGEWLIHWLGTITGCLFAIPVSLFTLQFLPFVFNAKRQSLQWQLWLVCCVVWAIFRHRATGVVGIFAYIWLGMAVMNLVASMLLGWRDSAGWRAMVLVGLHVLAAAVGFKFGWLWGIFCGATIAGIYCGVVLNPYCQWLGPVCCKAEDEEILITIDDGPDPHDTPMLLDLLDRYPTKAIFFMIGEKARDHPELVREVVRRGHEIGNHTLTHPQASFWCAGPWRTRREIESCQQVIEEITGTRPRWFRAPVGHRNLFVHPIARTLGLQVMAWNRRGFDAVEKDAGKVLTRILPHLTKGDIVLLHEATPIAAEVLEGVLKKNLNG